MNKGAILDAIRMKKEIEASHERSRRYNVSRHERNPGQACLTPAELSMRREASAEFLDVAVSQIEEFSELISPKDFMIAVADAEGYILHLAGSDELKIKFAERNCAPGFRWTERDVGTTATSLCLERQVPIQLNDKDHFCSRAHGFTSSAAPIFGRAGALLGVLVASGDSRLVHTHTLVMVITAARSIEKHLAVMRRNREMALHICFLDNVIEAAGTGLLTVDRDMRVWKTNRKGKQILKEDFDGKPVSVLGDIKLDLEDIRKNPGSWINRECRFTHGRRDIHFLFSAQPVISTQNETLGAVLAFEEFGNIRKLADNIAGTKAYFTFDHLIGKSESFRQAVDLARRASKSDSTVLLQGETGTGKELFAQAIHNAGARRGQPFVPLNCGAIPGDLLESELFGYVDGAFTGALKGGRPGKFELATGGTILLDEIGDMPHDMQVKLLRVLQTGEVQRIGARKSVLVDSRTIASTHVRLSDAVAGNRFRQDLYYRLNVLRIQIPPLRDRGPEDIRALAGFFLKRYGEGRWLSPEAAGALEKHDWPGNVRELENTIQRALHICENEALQIEHLGLGNSAGKRTAPMTGTLQEMEKKMIAAALEHTGSNMAATAKRLGISRATLYRKVKQYGLSE